MKWDVRNVVRVTLWRVLAVMLIVSAYFFGFRHGSGETVAHYAAGKNARPELEARQDPLRALVMLLLEGQESPDSSF